MGGGASSASKPGSPAAKAAMLQQATPLFFCFMDEEGGSTKAEVQTMTKIGGKFTRMRATAGAACDAATGRLVCAEGGSFGLADMFFVESGQLQLRGASDGETAGRTIRAGELRGERAVVEGGAAAAAAVVEQDESLKGVQMVAETDLIVLVLPAATFAELAEAPTAPMARWIGHVKELAARPVPGELLRHCEVFTALRPPLAAEELEGLARILHTRSFIAGDVVIEEGGLSENCFICTSGELEVLLLRNDGTEAAVVAKKETIKPPEFFGETALGQLEQSDHDDGFSATATVIAKTHVTVLYFQPEELAAVVQQHARLRPHFTEVLKMRLMAELSQGPLFHTFDADEVRQVTKMAKYVRFAPNSLIFAEGQMGEDFFILLHGEVTITSLGGLNVHLRNRGDFFGELALIRQSKRLGSVHAARTVALAKIDGEEFRRYFMSQELFAAEFEIKAMRKNTSVDAIIAHPRTRAAFRDICAADFLAECFECYNELREFRVAKELKNRAENQRSVTDNAKRIFYKYLDPTTSGDSCVTISNKTLATITAGLSDDQTLVDAEFLKEAAREVAENLTGALRKYVQSADYEKVLTDLGAYRELKTTATDKKVFRGSHGARRTSKLPHLSLKGQSGWSSASRRSSRRSSSGRSSGRLSGRGSLSMTALYQKINNLVTTPSLSRRPSLANTPTTSNAAVVPASPAGANNKAINTHSPSSRRPQVDYDTKTPPPS